MRIKKEGLEFTKMQTSGNDFIILDNFNKKFDTKRLKELSRLLCGRKFSIGADGLLVWERYKGFDGLMRIFNPDGSEPKMCGNGARCFALYLSKKLKKQRIVFKSPSSPIFAHIKENFVSIKMPDVRNIKLDIKLKIKGKSFLLDFLNTGVPHAVIFARNIDKMDISKYAPPIRYNLGLFPEGTNVDFVEKKSKNILYMRTYERGLEDETFACGTGAVASSIIYALRFTKEEVHNIEVRTKSGENLNISLKNKGMNFFDIWLKSPANFVYQGITFL